MPNQSRQSPLNYIKLPITAEKTYFGGLIPSSLTTVMTLALLTALIAGGMGLWAAALSAVKLSIPATFMPYVAIFATSFCAWTLGSIMRVAPLGAKPKKQMPLRNVENNPTNLQQMIEHLTAEINAYFRSINPDHQDLMPPAIFTVKDPGKLSINFYEGVTNDFDKLVISTGATNSALTGLNQKQLAALIAVEMVKGYQRRYSANIFIKAMFGVLNTLRPLMAENPNIILSAIAYVPYKFLDFFLATLNRTYIYEAADVVAKMGRKYDLMSALSIDADSQESSVAIQGGMHRKDDAMRAPYDGPFKSVLLPITNWIDSYLDHKGKYQTANRFLVLIIGSIDRAVDFLNEISVDKPRGFKLKDHIDRVRKKADVSVANDKFLQNQTHRIFNRQVNENARYWPIDHINNGVVAKNNCESVVCYKSRPNPEDNPASKITHYFTRNNTLTFQERFNRRVGSCQAELRLEVPSSENEHPSPGPSPSP